MKKEHLTQSEPTDQKPEATESQLSVEAIVKELHGYSVRDAIEILRTVRDQIHETII